MAEVADFWNAQAAAYQDQARRAARHHAVTAAFLEPRLAGNVLCVGGMWITESAPAIARGERPFRVTVLDVSAEMLAPYRDLGLDTLVGDARAVPAANGAYDHVVFSQVLHHITGRHGFDSRENVRRALRDAFRVLRPGGGLWIKEVILPSPIYAAELAAAPLTRRALGLAGIPLVVLHSQGFLEAAMRDAGFADLRRLDSRSKEDRWHQLMQPVVGLPWLRIPRGLYPVRNDLLYATKPA